MAHKFNHHRQNLNFFTSTLQYITSAHFKVAMHISWIQCARLWWRFLLLFLGLLLICSVVSNFLVVTASMATTTIFTDYSGDSFTIVDQFGLVYKPFLHAAGILSIMFFCLGQIAIFYTLLNNSKAVQKILFQSKQHNPYPAPAPSQNRLLENR
jgi:hypothetical protein